MRTGQRDEHLAFDITKQARLVPTFVEENAGEYFAHFERTTVNLGWPKKCWAMLLQTVLTGKAQRVYVTLSAEECSEYEAVKMVVLKNFELVPEEYRQKFQEKEKEDEQSYVKFLRDKEGLLDK